MSTLKLENLQHPDAAGTSISLASSGAISFASDVAFNTDTFYVDTANGRVGIGETSPNAPLTITAATADADGALGSQSPQLIIHGGNTNNPLEIGMDNSGGTAVGFIQSRNTISGVQYLSLNPNGGNVGIGTASPSSKLHITGDITLNNATATNAIGFDNFNNLTLYSDRSTSEYITYKGGIGHIFRVNDTSLTDISGQEAMRIDANGTLLVGKTATDVSTEGVELRPNLLVAVRNGGNPAYFRRNSNDGEIANFIIDGTKIGSIGSVSSDLVVHSSISGHNGLRFHLNGIYPTDNTGALADADANLGSSSARFQDLYLSGGVYVGGTGAANYLDDYEEGTWTPTLGGTATYNEQEGKYIKVGGLVYITCKLSVNAIGTGTTNRIQGLPFTSEVEGALSSEALLSLAVTTSFITFRTAGTDIYAWYATTATWNTLSGNPNYLTSGTQVELAGCYKTTA